MPDLYQDLQEKVKIKVLGTPMNMQGELVLDFRGRNSIKISAKLNTIANITVTGTATDGTARTKINEILTALRQYGIMQ